MAWLSRVNFVSSDTLSFTDINNLGNDIRAWGGNVNGGTYTLSNVAVSASTILIGGASGSNPSAKLDVQSTSVRFYSGSATTDSRLDVGNADVSGGQGGFLIFHASAATPYLSLNALSQGVAWRNIAIASSGGNVGIGTTTPSYQLQLSTDSAAKPSTNTWTIASDARLKTVLGDYKKGLDAICALRPVRYEYNGLGGMPADGKEHISIVAQEAQEVFPECIGTFVGKLHEDDEEETELLNYNGHAVTFALINAVRELKARLDALA